MPYSKESQVLQKFVPEFFTDSWNDVKNNEKLLIIYLWQAINAGGNDAETKEYIQTQLEAARECASTLTANTIEQCKQTVLRMGSMLKVTTNG